MSFLRLNVVNKNGVRVFYAPNKTREQVMEHLNTMGASFADDEIATGGFVTESLNKTSCIMIGLDAKNPIWFDEASVTSA